MSAYCGLSRWRTLAPNPVASGLILPVQNARCAAASVRDEGAKMLDDELRRGVRARLSDRTLFSATGMASIRRGTGRSCDVCGRSIDSPTLEREVEGAGERGLAHPACYTMWRAESALLKHPATRSRDSSRLSRVIW